MYNHAHMSKSRLVKTEGGGQAYSANIFVNYLGRLKKVQLKQMWRWIA